MIYLANVLDNVIVDIRFLKEGTVTVTLYSQYEDVTLNIHKDLEIINVVYIQANITVPTEQRHRDAVDQLRPTINKAILYHQKTTNSTHSITPNQ